MDFRQYEDQAAEFAVYPEEYALLYVGLGIASEAGEFAGKVKKLVRDGYCNKKAMIDELGDILWYLQEASRLLDVSLEEVAVRNILKLQDRKDRDALQGSGDDR